MKKKSKRNITMKVYLHENEYQEIIESSKRTGLSISTFARNVCLGSKVVSREDAQTRLDMIKINSDLRKLGGLLKLGITEKVAVNELRNVLHKIEATQAKLSAKVEEMYRDK